VILPVALQGLDPCLDDSHNKPKKKSEVNAGLGTPICRKHPKTLSPFAGLIWFDHILPHALQLSCSWAYSMSWPFESVPNPTLEENVGNTAQRCAFRYAFSKN